MFMPSMFSFFLNVYIYIKCTFYSYLLLPMYPTVNNCWKRRALSYSLLSNYFLYKIIKTCLTDLRNPLYEYLLANVLTDNLNFRGN